MFFLRSAFLAAAALSALSLAACQKETDLAANAVSTPGAAPPADQVAANTPSAASLPPADVQSPQISTQTIADVAASQAQFSTLVSAAKAAGLESELAGPGPITVFAPTDAAFASLPPGELEALMKPENKAQLAALLKHHIIAGTVTHDELLQNPTETSLNGDLKVEANQPNQLKVADANVIGPPIKAANGMIHVVDKVLIPAT